MDPFSLSAYTPVDGLLLHKAAPRLSSSQRRAYEWLLALADSFEPKVRKAFLQAVDMVRGSVDAKQLSTMIGARDREATIRYLSQRADALKEALGTAVVPTLARVFQEAGVGAVSNSLAVALSRPPSEVELLASFDITNPRAVQHLRTYGFNLIREVTDETRRAVGDVVLHAFEQGGHPYVQAREIKNLVGLTARQARAAANYRAALSEEGRDIEQVARMADKYAARLLRQRAENIARTETIRASAEGQQELFRQARDRGLFLGADPTRKWVVTPDDRLCPICAEIPGMNVGGVRLDEPFETPKGPMMTPPVHPQCRCAVVMSV